MIRRKGKLLIHCYFMSQWIVDNSAEIKDKGSKVLYGNGEFKVSDAITYTWFLSETSKYRTSKLK